MDNIYHPLPYLLTHQLPGLFFYFASSSLVFKSSVVFGTSALNTVQTIDTSSLPLLHRELH